MLAAGTRFGPYEVVMALGAGGMGEVYRALDTRLNREVALKVLGDLFSSDLDRLARVKREAQLLVSLSHPNIAAIYGVEDADGVRALVLESFVAGAPRMLFEKAGTAGLRSGTPGNTSFEVTGDGQRFLLNLAAGPEESPGIGVMLNWRDAPR
jgi:serine/threonine protein kinase